MQTYRRLLALLALVLATSTAQADTFGTGANQFSLDFVPISAATNPGSGLPAGPNFFFTGVHNDYRMGTYEISNDQWNKFVANLLPVTVTGNPSSAYDTSPQYTGTHVPTNNVSWYEAAQFVNWLNTSTGHTAAYKFTGTQGQPDYTLATWSPTDAAGGTNLYRNKEAYYFLPTEDEWVKAAYWNGTALQQYANATADDLVSGSPDPAKWNYGLSAGSAPWNVGSGNQELNGTYDMMGNVWEWMESPYSDPNYGTSSRRGLRGGAFGLTSYFMAESFRYFYDPALEGNDSGFRVASVPEPGCLTLLGAALAGLICWKRRR